MARDGDAPATVELERQSRGRDAHGKPGRVRLAPDGRREALARRLAKRQGLALMLASAVVSLLILYGVWLALSSLF